MSITVGAALKKIAVALLSDKKTLKKAAMVAFASFLPKFLLLTVNSYFPPLGVCLHCKSGKEKQLWRQPATSAPRSPSPCTTG